jgi:PAS domain S-box-containing protein
MDRESSLHAPAPWVMPVPGPSGRNGHEAEEAPDFVDSSQVNVLLVDDRPDKLLALEAVLSTLGQNLVKATSGKEALRLLLKQDFAVILLDVFMPVMDGFETAAMIRRRPSSEFTPIIFITSQNDSENHIARGYSLGAVDYILSPIIPTVLRSKVSVFVELYKKTEQIRRQSEQLRKIEEAEHRRRLTEAVDRLEAETKRNRFFTLALEMLAITDFDGGLLQLNPSWEQTLGFSPEEMKAASIVDLVHPEDRAAMYRELLRLQEGAQTTYCEARFQRKDGAYRWLGWTAAPFASEKLIYMFARDVTQRRLADEKIATLNSELERRVAQLTEINSELESFNYSISHDLRAPIRSMQGFARALIEEEEARLSADGKEYAHRILNSSVYMDTLLRDLLNYSRLSREEINLVPVDLEAAVQEVLTMVSREIRDRDARVEILPPLGRVMAHPGTLSQVLTNLIVNAVKFVPAGRQPHVRISSEPGFTSRRLVVQDNGIGISPAHHKKIFGLFERLHGESAYPGTGVGLAIVRKGIERMGGKVGLESEEGKGSKFWIEFPQPPAEGPQQ